MGWGAESLVSATEREKTDTRATARTGPKLPLKLKEIWCVRIRLQMANRVRDLAVFDLGLDSKLRGCDLVKLRLADVTIGRSIRSSCMVVQQKTSRPVQFEITDACKESLIA
jgi:hypothetical protein